MSQEVPSQDVTPWCVFCGERRAKIGAPGLGKPSCHPCKQSFTMYHQRSDTPRPGRGWWTERAHELATIWGGRRPW